MADDGIFDMTYMDRVVAFLNETKSPSAMVHKLLEYFEYEEYDTDSVLLDVDERIDNIANHMENEAFMESIAEFILSQKSMFVYNSFLISSA